MKASKGNSITEPCLSHLEDAIVQAQLAVAVCSTALYVWITSILRGMGWKRVGREAAGRCTRDSPA